MAQTEYQKTLLTVKLAPATVELLTQYIELIEKKTGVAVSKQQAIASALKGVLKETGANHD